MAAPPPYERTHSFTDWSTNHPDEPHRGQDLDHEFDALDASLTATQENLALIQREDGALANDSVHPDALDDDTLQLIKEQASSTPGPQGPAGPAIPGPVGLSGPRGDSIPWLIGTGVPSNAIGIERQLYLNSDNGDVYQKTATGWVLSANIKGAAGSGGGISDHGQLTGLGDADHPISAVQGLQGALNDLEQLILGGLDETTSIYRQPEAPTANLNAGDLWFDTDDGNRQHYWDGVSWIDVADARIQLASDLAGDAITAAAGAQATADGKVTTYYASSAPTGLTAADAGDLWFNAAGGNVVSRWSGTAWVRLQDASIADALEAAGEAQATADGKIVTFYQPTAPDANQSSVGDIWFDTDDGNHQYRYSGATWVSVQDLALAQAVNDAARALDEAVEARDVADGKIEVYYLAAAPTEVNSGDLWIRTTDRQMFRWDGSQWVSVQDVAISQAFNNSSLALATADSKIRAFYQTTAPTGMVAADVGDLWFDTDDNKRPYYWTGSAWTDISWINGVQSGQITGVSIQNGAITAEKLSVTQLSAITANMGAITAGTIALSASGHIRAGQTGYNVGNGFWMGIDGGVPKFSFGAAGGNRITWDGTSLAIVYDGVTITPNGSTFVKSASGASASGNPGNYTPSISVSGGTAPYTYAWTELSDSHEDITASSLSVLNPTFGASTPVAALEPHHALYQLVVTDAAGRKSTALFGFRFKWISTL